MNITEPTEPSEVKTYLDSREADDYGVKLTSKILYTPRDGQEPYYIEGSPELGTFSSWDDAYDALLESYEPLDSLLESLLNDSSIFDDFAEDV